MLYSGGTFPKDKLTQCVKRFWKPFARAYGVTETSGCSVTTLVPDDHILEGPESRLLASAGRPLGRAKVRILDRNRNRLQPGQVGELVVKGDNVMMGYWKNPDLTRQVLRSGWLQTGDIGYMDGDGYVFVLGRKTELAAHTSSNRLAESAAALADIPADEQITFAGYFGHAAN